MNDWLKAEQHVEKAHEHYEAGRWADAESELREALALDPSRADWHFNLGLTLEAAGRWADAVHALRDAHDLDPGDAQIVLQLGLNCLRADEPREAKRWLTEARRLDEDRVDALVALIEAHTRLGEHDDAEVCFYQALHAEGGSGGAADQAQAYANIAESLIDRGLTDRAVFCLREAASLDPGLPRVHARLGQVYADHGRFERARQMFLRELRDNPGDIETIIDLGCVLVDMNRLGEAGEKFRRVLEMEPENPDAHFQLGDLAMRQHRAHDAAASFRLVMDLDPDYPGVRRRLARLHLRCDQADEARRLLNQELRRLRTHPEEFTAPDLDELGLLLLDTRLPHDAAGVLERLVEMRPDDPASLHRLAVAHFERGDRVSGLRLTRRVLRVKRNHLAALHNMALALAESGRLGAARVYARRAHEVDPEDASVRRLQFTLRVRRVAAWAGRLIRRRSAIAS